MSPKVVCDISFLLTSLGVPKVLTARFDEILTVLTGGPHVSGYFDLLPSSGVVCGADNFNIQAEGSIGPSYDIRLTIDIIKKSKPHDFSSARRRK